MWRVGSLGRGVALLLPTVLCWILSTNHGTPYRHCRRRATARSCDFGAADCMRFRARCRIAGPPPAIIGASPYLAGERWKTSGARKPRFPGAAPTARVWFAMTSSFCLGDKMEITCLSQVIRAAHVMQTRHWRRCTAIHSSGNWRPKPGKRSLPCWPRLRIRNTAS